MLTRQFALNIVILAFTLQYEMAGAQGDQRGIQVRQTQSIERRVALVIGNGSYKDSPLVNPVNDAQDIAATLRAMNFEVVLGVNLSQEQMELKIQNFGRMISGGGVGLFYYAGHGIQVNGANYLVPVDANITIEEEVKYKSVDAGFVLAQMESARNRLNIIILDACRNYPFARSFRSTQQGLASIDAPSGTLIAYATAPGQVASDGTGRNGLYTQEFLKYVNQPDLSILQIFMKVRAAVRSQTQGKQVPWESSSLESDFYFSSLAGKVDGLGNKPLSEQSELNPVIRDNNEKKKINGDPVSGIWDGKYGPGGFPLLLRLRLQGENVSGEHILEGVGSSIVNGKWTGTELEFTTVHKNSRIKMVASFKSGKLVGRKYIDGSTTPLEWSAVKR